MLKEERKVMKKLGAIIAAAFVMIAGTTTYAADSVFEGIVLYIPHRIVDAFDVFSMTVGFGPTARVKVYSTRYLAFGAGVGVEASAVKQINRQYGAGLESGWDASFAWLSAEHSQREDSIGSLKDYYYYETGIPSPSERIYDYFEGTRDFWSIGVDTGAGLVKFSFELHPVEIADFITGWLFIDLKDDDFGVEDINL